MALELSGSQLKLIHEALLRAYTSHAQLAKLVRFELDESLDRIGGNEALDVVAFKLIEWAEANGKIEKLIIGAVDQNPGNHMLAMLVEQIREHQRKEIDSQQVNRSYREESEIRSDIATLIGHHLADNGCHKFFPLLIELFGSPKYFFSLFKQEIDKLLLDDEQLIDLLEWSKAENETAYGDLPPAIGRAYLLALSFTFYNICELALDLADALDRTSEIDIRDSYRFGIANDDHNEWADAGNLELNRAQIAQMTNYLQANRFLVECLNLAHVSNRQDIEDSLLLPPESKGEQQKTQSDGDGER